MDTFGKLMTLGVVALFLGLCFGASALSPEFSDPSPTDGSGIEYVPMVKPNGWMPARDATYAGDVNLPNSAANLTNAQAREIDARAQIAKMQFMYGSSSAFGYRIGLWAGVGFGFLCFVGFLFFVALPVYMFATVRRGRMQKETVAPAPTFTIVERGRNTRFMEK